MRFEDENQYQKSSKNQHIMWQHTKIGIIMNYVFYQNALHAHKLAGSFAIPWEAHWIQRPGCQGFWLPRGGTSLTQSFLN